MLKSVRYPPHLLANGLTGARRGYEGKWNVAAADTETVNGEPYCLQFSTGPNPADVRIFDVSPATILETFLDEVREWARPRRVNVVYFHVLKYDLQALLYNRRELFGRPEREFQLDCGRGVVLHAFADKIWFARVTFPDKRAAWICDSRAFFVGSLDHAAKMTQAPYQKLRKPAGLGARRLSGETFEHYIRNDVLAGYHVGRAIEGMHKEYDVRLSVSAPHFASRVFRKSYLTPHTMPFPPGDIARAAELAYHGGKNQMSVPAGWYHRAWELDINSAYTAAMRDLPSFVKGEYVRVHEPPHGEHGVVNISGRRAACPYGVVFTHSFQPLQEEFHDVWVTTYELEEALRHKEIELKECWGWIWKADRKAPRPLRLYAETFFKLKADVMRQGHAKGSLPYYTAKLLSNSLYGKFMQTVREVTEVDLDPDTGKSNIVETWKAGGLYHPFIACLITGYVRAKLHAMEHRSRALHSSTDAVKTQVNPRELRDQIGDRLGQWSVEIGPSRLLLLRPKLYVHEPVETTGKPKYALHGFWGDLTALLKAAGTEDRPGPLFRGKRFKYFARHCWSIRESLIQHRKHRVALKIEQTPRELLPLTLRPAV